MKVTENLCWDKDFGNDKMPNSLRKTPSRSSRKSPPPSRNPFLNFLRDFRKSNSGIGSVQLFRKGGEVWRKMNQDQKLLYMELAKSAPKKRKRRSGGGRRRRSRRSRSRSRSRRDHSGGSSD